MQNRNQIILKLNNFRIMKKIFSVVIILTFLAPGLLCAQTESGIGAEGMLMAIAGLLTFTIIVLAAVIFSLNSLQKVLKLDKMEKLREAGVDVEEEQGWFSKLYNRLWGYKPIEEEQDILLDHDYDGIHELDNHLPPWWKYLFYFTIAFGVVYIVSYHVLEISPLQVEEYNMELAEAERQSAIRSASMAGEEGVDEADIVFSDNPEDLASGEKVFQMQCAACHRPDGGGSIGPNLTDEFWLHGGSMSDIYRTIKVGVPDKGMISWEASLSATQMRDVSSYIITLQGTNPENPKAEQGDKYVPAPASETTDDTQI